MSHITVLDKYDIALHFKNHIRVTLLLQLLGSSMSFLGEFHLVKHLTAHIFNRKGDYYAKNLSKLTFGDIVEVIICFLLEGSYVSFYDPVVSHLVITTKHKT